MGLGLVPGRVGPGTRAGWDPDPGRVGPGTRAGWDPDPGRMGYGPGPGGTWAQAASGPRQDQSQEPKKGSIARAMSLIPLIPTAYGIFQWIVTPKPCSLLNRLATSTCAVENQHAIFQVAHSLTKDFSCSDVYCLCTLPNSPNTREK